MKEQRSKETAGGLGSSVKVKRITLSEGETFHPGAKD